MPLASFRRSAAVLILVTVALAVPPGAPASPAQSPEALAAAGDAPRAKKLRVVIKVVEPFVLARKDEPAGFSIELWDRVARLARLDYEYVWVQTTRDMLAAVREGKADVAVGALSITAERETQFDFSHSFFGSGLQVLIRQGATSRSPFAAFAGLLKPEVFKVVGVLLLALLLNSHLLWLMERHRNPDEFPHSCLAGVWESTWWSVCTLITGGCENKAPAGITGRLVAIVWMLAGVGLFSYITATIASTMTVNTLTSDVRGLADLRGQTIATVDGSTAQTYLRDQGIEPRAFPDVAATCQAVANGAVRAAVYDAPIVRYHLKRYNDSSLELVGSVFDKQDYGFVLAQGSPYRKLINRALLRLQEEGYTDELEHKWFSTGE